jgi:homoserine dehydrogenase
MTQEQSGQHEAGAGAVGQEELSSAEQAIAADIERTRAELGQTVQQLADKAHVATRAKHAAADVRDRAVRAARDLPATARRYSAQVAAATVVLALAVLAVRKLRK